MKIVRVGSAIALLFVAAALFWISLLIFIGYGIADSNDLGGLLSIEIPIMGVALACVVVAIVGLRKAWRNADR
jgi:membrane protein DedA with SNARE-associated domain